MFKPLFTLQKKRLLGIQNNPKKSTGPFILIKTKNFSMVNLREIYMFLV